MFTSDFFKKNRLAIRESVSQNSIVVLSAHGKLQRSTDTTFPFRQESNFWYLTGINEPDCILVMDKMDEYLIMPHRTEAHEVFEGAVSGEQLQTVSGIKKIYQEKEGWSRLKAGLKRAKQVATITPPSRYVDRAGIYTNPSRARLLQRLRASRQTFEVVDLREKMAELRCVKQSEELEVIRKAIDITCHAFNKLSEQGFAQFKHEYEIEAELTYAYRKHDAVHGYEPIVASGDNACTLHYVANDSPVKTGQLLLIDSGAELMNYSADITRTFQVGAITARQRAVYEIVARAQAQMLNQVRPGITMRELDELALHYLGEGLKQLGLITSSTDEGSIRDYYPHSIGHFLGLDVHDTGRYDAELQPGMVLTVEPGLYIPEESIGVRIEDNVCVTTEGYELMSAACK